MNHDGPRVMRGVGLAVAAVVLLVGLEASGDEVIPLNASLGERAIVLKKPGFFEAQVSTYRSSIRSYRLLKEQFDQKQREVPRSDPRPPDAKFAPGPLDLVSTWDAPYYPFAVHFEELEGAPKIRRTVLSDPRHPVVEDDFWSLYASDPIFTVLDQSDTEVHLVWPDPGTDDSSMFIVRTWRVAGDYLLEGSVRLVNLGDGEINGRMRMAMTGWDSLAKSNGGGCGMMLAERPDLQQVACRIGEELESKDQMDLVGTEIGLGTGADFVGINSRYFLTAAIPLNDVPVQCLGAADTGGSFAAVMQWERFRLKRGADTCIPSWIRDEGAMAGRVRCKDAESLLGLTGPYDVAALGTAYSRAVARASSETERDRLEKAKNSLLPGRKRDFPFTAYIGPKYIDRLEEVGSGLDDTIDFWVLGFLCKPMLWILRTSYGLIPSYGLAIILLTLIVKLLTLYPTQKSMQQMKRMGDLKPKMDEIREKFKDDKTKTNQAMMDLYKREKVNPLGGCLPMLLQMPIWIALYRTIYGAVDLYHMPLFLWIDDLSGPDPYYVMPVLLGALMFLQQKMTPTMGDQTQAKMMMYMMPIMFTVFMWFLPSGLVFYILINTVLAIGHQWYVRRPTKAVSTAG